MMKYFSAALLIIISCANGCNNEASIKKRFKTKDKFRCNPKIEIAEYSNDTSFFIKKFRSYIDAKKGPFNAPAYNKQTVIYIDTVLYSSDKNYAALLVIEKAFYNDEWNYDGGSHFAAKLKDSLTSKSGWKIYDNHGARHISSETYEKMSNIIRQSNLIGRSYEASKKHETGYNLDDCRFWTSDEFRKEIQASGFVNIP